MVWCAWCQPLGAPCAAAAACRCTAHLHVCGSCCCAAVACCCCWRWRLHIVKLVQVAPPGLHLQGSSSSSHGDTHTSVGGHGIHYNRYAYLCLSLSYLYLSFAGHFAESLTCQMQPVCQQRASGLSCNMAHSRYSHQHSSAVHHAAAHMLSDGVLQHFQVQQTVMQCVATAAAAAASATHDAVPGALAHLASDVWCRGVVLLAPQLTLVPVKQQ